jgi:hypothetical protein
MRACNVILSNGLPLKPPDSEQWRSSGLWHHLVTKVDTTDSEDNAASIFKMQCIAVDSQPAHVFMVSEC